MEGSSHGRRGASVAGALITMCILAACAAPTQTTSGVDVSRVKTYSSLTEVRRDSTAVVVATALPGYHKVPADLEKKSGVDAIETRLRVERVVAGHLNTSLVTIRGLDPGQAADEISPLMTPGHTYLLYITPFVWRSGGTRTGKYVLTGDVGEFESAGDSFVKQSPGAAHLPNRITTGEVKSMERRLRE